MEGYGDDNCNLRFFPSEDDDTREKIFEKMNYCMRRNTNSVWNTLVLLKVVHVIVCAIIRYRIWTLARVSNGKAEEEVKLVVGS